MTADLDGAKQLQASTVGPNLVFVRRQCLADEEGGEAKNKVQDGKVTGGVEGQPATNLASSTLYWSMSRQLNDTGGYRETQDDVSTT